MRKSFLEDLNDEQRQAVLFPFDQPLFIYAGAGSGKTRTLICRITNMIYEGVDPNKILAITFTRKAAEEIRERLRQFVGPRAGEVVTSTFHQLCLKILKEHAVFLGLGDFKVADPQFQTKVVRMACCELLKNGKDKALQASSTVLRLMTSKMVNFVRRAKTLGKKSDEFQNDLSFVLKFYEDTLKKSKRIDFSDFLYLTEKLLKENPRIAYEYGKTYEYILIDEFQDTSSLNFAIIKLIMGKRSQKITIVGDIRQSIYGFRGADPHNISQFLSDYPQAKRIVLNQNYRSTQTILNAAQSMISKDNSEDADFSIPLISRQKHGDLVKVFDARDSLEEVEMIANEIERLVHPGSKYQYRDIVVMFRMRRISADIEMELFRHNIPYTHKKGVGFFWRRDVREVLSYARLVMAFDEDGPDPNQLLANAVETVINVPNRNIGANTIKELKDRCGSQSMLTVLKNLREEDFGPQVRRKLQGFVDLIHKMNLQICFVNSHLLPDSALRMIIDMTKILEEDARDEDIRETGVDALDELNDAMTDHISDKRETLEMLVEEARRFGSRLMHLNTQTELTSKSGLQKFINAITLESLGESTKNAVTLSTIHQMKGLESPVCFIMRFNQGVIPVNDVVCLDSGIEGFAQVQTLEEERRIAYVAITRAKERLYLSFCRAVKEKPMEPSQFLAEIENRCLAKKGLTADERQEVHALMKYVDDDIDDFELDFKKNKP